MVASGFRFPFEATYAVEVVSLSRNHDALAISITTVEAIAFAFGGFTRWVAARPFHLFRGENPARIHNNMIARRRSSIAHKRSLISSQQPDTLCQFLRCL